MARERVKGNPIEVGGQEIGPGEHAVVDLPVAGLYTHTQLTMPVHVVNGRHAGPTLFLTAALHGDELNGVEIIKRVLRLSALKRLHGCLLAVPVVNVFGFVNRSRYLPDRRDLNRSFPGRETGSIAARLANLLATEIVEKSNFGIDLHTGAVDRSNLPQIRADLSNPDVLALARVFGTPVIINSNLREGSLREYAADKGIPTLLYEAGEALRFDEVSIRAGVRGVSRVMRELGMLPKRKTTRTPIDPVQSGGTSWVRAPRSGIVRTACRLGQRVRSAEVLATVSDPFGEVDIEVPAMTSGIVIGRSMSPLAHEGDALFHLARFDDVSDAAQTVDEFHEAHGVDESWG